MASSVSVTPATTTSVGVAPSAGVLTSIYKNITFSWQGYIGFYAVITGSVLIAIGKSAATSDQILKDNFVQIGSVILTLGILAMVITREGIGAFNTWRTSVSGGGWLTLVLVVAVTIALFTLFFYNFAPAETLPFASTVLIVLTVIGIIGTLYAWAGRAVLAASITKFIFALYFFLPYALFVFGFIIDMINKKLEYIPASFSGLTGILFNYALSVVINKGVPPVATNALCEVPGLSVLTSDLAPQPMMFTLTTIAHMATYISRSKIADGTLKFANTAGNIWPIWVLYVGMWGLHAAVFKRNQCADNQTNTKLIWGLLLPLVYGGITGAIQSVTLAREGFTDMNVIEKFISESFDTIELAAVSKDEQLKKPKGSSSSEPEVATCAKGAKDGEFICESFENGVLKSQVMTE